MAHYLSNKNIVIGITGGIAAYKSPDVVRRLRELNSHVRVVMTRAAKEFITPLTLQAVSHHAVIHDALFDEKAEAGMGHIELARWADAILVAPATADFIAKLAGGIADDLLSTICLATQAPIALAPAMNQVMWHNSSTQANIRKINQSGIHIFGPDVGEQACGDMGLGRMVEPSTLITQLNDLFSHHLFAGKKILLTAGPTQEPIDPIRYISNASSGKMGYALAEACVEAGGDVTLISGPVNLIPPRKLNFKSVHTAEEMYHAVMQHISDYDVFISVAAVADFRTQEIAPQKIAKHQITNLKLERTKDILTAVTQLPHKPWVIGFAAETEDLLAKAKHKLQQKNLDMIIVNNALQAIGSDENEVIALWNEQHNLFPKSSKSQIARSLVKLIAKTFFKKEEACKKIDLSLG